MPKVNEPQRVITRGRTRTIGEPRRPHEGAGTPATRAKPTTATAPVGRPRSSDNGQGRFAQGEKREPPTRTVPDAGDTAPRTVAHSDRPLDRIARLEADVATLMALLVGNGQPPQEGEPPPAMSRLNDLELVSQGLAESLGELTLRVGSSGTEEAPATGLVAAVADLSDRLLKGPSDTLRPTAEAATEPEAAAAPEPPKAG